MCVYVLEATIAIPSTTANFFYINIDISRMKNVCVEAHELNIRINECV